MKHILRVLCAVALVAACASAAGAQCEFNALARARGMKASMVRAFVGCPTTWYGVYINTETDGGMPACNPVLPKIVGPYEFTDYQFDPHDGRCDLRARAVIEPDCSLLENAAGDPLGLPAGPCHVTYVKSTCRGIMQADGVTPINREDDAGWWLATLTRVTFNDATNGDMTVIDFPLTFSYRDPDNGRIKLDSSTAEALTEVLVDIGGAALPTCTSMQLLSLTLKDPRGMPFAVLGGSTR